ncbi:DUF3846 domain-containing protein [Brevibacillus sp. NPDC058079]|uniref:DUF3846 domain-containing protein n=1 Tax=Brevibacillus sp. NPDC058079 TaxID=3346330 RepID=UPI0036E88D5F
MAMFVIVGGKMMSQSDFERLLFRDTEMNHNEVLGYKGDDKIRVVMKAPLQQAEIKLIGKDLESMQAIVGGDIDCIPLGTTNLDLYHHSTGKMEKLMPNLKYEENGKVLDIMVGTVFVSKVLDGEEVSLAPHECFQAITELEKLSIKSANEALHFRVQVDRMY